MSLKIRGAGTNLAGARGAFEQTSVYFSMKMTNFVLNWLFFKKARGTIAPLAPPIPPPLLKILFSLLLRQGYHLHSLKKNIKILLNWPFHTRKLQKMKEIGLGTWGSQPVTHASTNHARRCLTSQIGRDGVHSTWYGPSRQFITQQPYLYYYY